MQMGVAGTSVCVLCIPTLQQSILRSIHLVFLTDKITHMSKLEI